MDGRARNARIEIKKEVLLQSCKEFFRATRGVITTRESEHHLKEILHNTEELMRAQGEIP